MLEFVHDIANLFILILLEVILGIDNIIFLAILTDPLNEKTRNTVRAWGLGGALILRLILLAFATVIVTWSEPVFSFFDFSISPHDLFFILGGGFLIYKSLKEIALELDLYESKDKSKHKKYMVTHQSLRFLLGTIVQVMIMDLIFSLDSILTAVGLSNSLVIMSLAIIFAIAVMFFASRPTSRFIHKHPSLKMLALSFLVMLGFILFFDGFHWTIRREYLYFAMFFSLTVEGLNLLYRHRKNSGDK